jgi:hypothetical protein
MAAVYPGSATTRSSFTPRRAAPSINASVAADVCDADSDSDSVTLRE